MATNKKSGSLLNLFLLVVLMLSIVFGLKLVKTKQQSKVGAAPASIVSVSPASQSLNPGATANFSILMDTNENKLTGVDIILKFNPQVLEVTAIARGENISSFENTIESSFDNTKGEVVYSAFTIDQTKAVSGSNLRILNVYAKVKDGAGLGSYALEIDTSTAASAVSESQNVITSRVNGSFNIIAQSPTNPPAGEPNSCGGTCGSNNNCKSGLFCYQGYCRNPQCASSTDCSCTYTQTTTPTARPATGTTRPRATTPPVFEEPLQTPVPLEEVGFGSENNSVDENGNEVIVEYSPLPQVDKVEDSETDNKLSNIFKVIVYILGGAFVIALAYYGYQYYRSKTQGPTIINPE